MRSVVSACVLICAASAALAADQDNPLGIRSFITGQEYVLHLNMQQRSLYVQGAWDGMLSNLDEADIKWMQGCVVGWKAGQMAAVLEKYFTDHPEKWNLIAGAALPMAIAEKCPTAGRKFF